MQRNYGRALVFFILLSVSGWSYGQGITHAPELLGPRNGIIYRFVDVYCPNPSYDPPGIDFAWSGVVGAATYEVEVQFPEGNSAFPWGGWTVIIRTSQTFWNGYCFRFFDISQADEYYRAYPWRVRGVDSLGNPGPYSGERTFSLVSVMPTPTPAMVGDVNEDGDINARDLFKISNVWGETISPASRERVRMDLHRDYQIDRQDLLKYTRDFKERLETAVSVPQPLIPQEGRGYDVIDSMQRFTTGEPFFFWRSVEDAITYDIQYFGDTAYSPLNRLFEAPDLEGISQGQGILGAVMPVYYQSMGRWIWRIRARAESGRVSPWSDWIEFYLIRLTAGQEGN